MSDRRREHHLVHHRRELPGPKVAQLSALGRGFRILGVLLCERGEVLALERLLVELDHFFLRRFLLRVGRVGRDFHGDMRDLDFAGILDEQIAMLVVVLLDLRVGGLHVMRPEFVVEHFLDQHRPPHRAHQLRVRGAVLGDGLAFRASDLELARVLPHFGIGKSELAFLRLLQQ